MRKSKKILAAAAIVLPLSIGMGSALAYFTANTEASGGYAVEVGNPKTEIDETFNDWTKHVTVKNTGEVPVFVRLRVFAGNKYPLEYTLGTGWSKVEEKDKNGKVTDTYYLYNQMLAVKGETSPVDIEIQNVPSNATGIDEFNVMVVCERTPKTRYDEETKKLVPDWTYAVKEVVDPDKEVDPDKVVDPDKGENAEDIPTQPETSETPVE